VISPFLISNPFSSKSYQPTEPLFKHEMIIIIRKEVFDAM